MERFIDREQEMETLQSEYERKGSSLVILYGRRRAGKTTLISEFIKDKNTLFFLASEESEPQNRNAFKERPLTLSAALCSMRSTSLPGTRSLKRSWSTVSTASPLS